MLSAFALVALTGCVTTLAEIHSEEPRKAATFQVPFQEMYACAKHGSQLHDWRPETAIVEYVDGQSRAHIISSVYGMLGRMVIFEMIMEPTASSATLVEYRSKWMGGSIVQEQAWNIVNACAGQLLGPQHKR